MKQLEFENGDKMPAIGLGTWKSEPGEVGRAVQTALNAGYRHIDCAAIYGNEKEIGEALSRVFDKGTVKREEVWITSKLWNNAHKKEDVKPALKKTLSDLKLNYLDLYLIHWPVAFKPGLEGFPENDDDFLSLDEAPLAETWNAMLDSKKHGLIKHAGVSNFSIKKLEQLTNVTGTTPSVNQVELHPYLQQNELLEYCKKNGIHITAYSPLGSTDRPDALKADDEPSLLENETIIKIAEKHNATPAQILIQWHVERGTSVIPKSTNPGRIRENLHSQEFTFDEADMNQIKSLDRHFRFINGKFFETESNMYRNIFDD